MVPEYNKIHNSFKLNGVHYSYEDLKAVAYDFIKEGLAYEAVIGRFLLDWLDENDFVEVNTSGSTGKPKHIKLKKQAMVYSAIATGNFFKLKPSNTALHCLPSNFIAGKMMLVRAIILGLELDMVEPKSKLIFDTDKPYNFCAMVPMQLQNSSSNLNKIKTIIVGGASVSKSLADNIQDIKSNVYETYGMTETITHIAIKQLNHVSSSTVFKTLPNVSISQDNRDCLVIEAPKLSDKKIITNDIVKLHSNTEFEWLGRFDNVINSGGIKLFPEQIEAKLQSIIKQRFFIASESDESLGDKVILVIESDSNMLQKNVFNHLEKYEVPKKVYSINRFIETDSGKIQRKKTLELLKD